MPVVNGVTSEVLGAIQCSFDDLLCKITVEEMVNQLGARDWKQGTEEGNALVNQLADGKRQHANDHAQFHDLLCDEIYGGLDALQDILEEVMVQVARISGVSGPVSDDERKSGGKMLTNLIVNAFKFRKIGAELPQIHIHAALHAALMWDKNRKYNVNDFEDIRHACVALPYYDVFCTERGLCHQISQKLLQLDKVYGTKVFATDEEFLAHVNSISDRALTSS